MAFTSRIRTLPGAGTIVALILVLAFGNPSYRDWAARSQNADNVGGFLLKLLAWPAWSVSSSQSLRDVLSRDITAILLVVFTAILLSVMLVGSGSSVRGNIGGIFAGWAAFLFAAAFAALIGAFVGSHATVLGAFTAAGFGAMYGLFVGWIIGLVSLSFRGG